MDFRVVIKNKDHTQEWELPYSTFNLSKELNKDRRATIVFDRLAVEDVASAYGTTARNILGGAYRDIFVYDSETLLYAGYVAEINFARREKETGTITVTSKGYFNLLAKRFTDVRSYTSTDSAQIAWDLINYTQSLSYGDFGITAGSLPTTINRNRTFRYKNIKEAIEKLSNLYLKNGFDFEIDNDKKFNVFYPEKGSSRPEIVFEDDFNIESYTIRELFMDAMANQVLVFGQGYGDDMIVETRDASSTYKSNFYLLQSTLQEKDVKETSTLQDKGDKYLDRYKYPRFVITVNCTYDRPDWSQYDVGDWVTLKIDQESINDLYRVNSKRLNHDGRVTVGFVTM